MLRGVAYKYMRLSRSLVVDTDLGAEDILYRAAITGLWRAIKRYDLDRGTPLRVFARKAVKKEALRALADANRALGPRGWRVEKLIRQVRALVDCGECDVDIAATLGVS